MRHPLASISPPPPPPPLHPSHPTTWKTEVSYLCREHQPCIIFMDEIDAIGGRRFSEGTSADREIQRTLMELLSQLDGFDVLGKVGACSLRWSLLFECGQLAID